MTQPALHADKDQPITFINIFNRSKDERNKSVTADLISSRISENPLLSWFEKSNYLTVVNVQALSPGKILHVGHITVRFKLSNFYYDKFILLRGLLEFSRPKQVSISSNTSDKTFELRVSEDQIQSIKTYLDKILSLFVKEIKFKASLNSVLQFERSFKEQQSKLYEELRALA